MGRGYVDIYKTKEDGDIVWYRFEKSIIEKRYFNNPNDTDHEVERRIVQGYGKFNKHNGEFVVDKDKTDQYFFEDEFWLGAVHVKLHKYYEAGLDFPDATCWAS